MFKKHKQLRGFWNCFPRVAPSTTREMVLNALHRKEEKLNREYFFSFRKGGGNTKFPKGSKETRNFEPYNRTTTESRRGCYLIQTLLRNLLYV